MEAKLKRVKLKDLPEFQKQSLHDTFYYPYKGCLYIYDNLVYLKTIYQEDFHTLLSHRYATNGFSTSMGIHQTIEDAVGGFSGKRVLDIGSSIGHFCFLFAEDGAKVVGIEKEQLKVGTAQAIALIKHFKGIEFVCDKIENVIEHRNMEDFNLTNMLNVFDHMIREDNTKAWKTLNKISELSEKLTLMMGPTDEFPKADYTSNLPEKVMEKTQYKHYSLLLGSSYAGRALWLFFK